MRLDGRLRHAELIGDLLVEQPFRQHAEHTRLLRRQRLQPLDQVGNLRIALDAEVDAFRRGDAAAKHRLHRAANVLHARRFRDEARRAELERAADGFRIVMRRHHDQRNGGVDAAQRDQAGKARRARHGEVEQHEVDVVVAGHDRLGAVEIAGFEDRRDVADAGKRLLQRAAEKRMVVRDHELVSRRQMSLPLRRALCLAWTQPPIMRRRRAFSSDNAGIRELPRGQVLSVPGSAGLVSSLSKSFTIPMKLRKKRSM